MVKLLDVLVEYLGETLKIDVDVDVAVAITMAGRLGIAVDVNLFEVCAFNVFERTLLEPKGRDFGTPPVILLSISSGDKMGGLISRLVFSTAEEEEDVLKPEQPVAKSVFLDTRDELPC